MKFEVPSDIINELFEKYTKLGVHAKRDALSEEIMKITYLLRTLLNNYG